MNKTDSVSSHHPELVDVPVREVRLVQDCHLVDEEGENDEDENYDEDEESD